MSYRITENDCAIVRALWENRYLTIEELVQITGRVSKTANPNQLVRKRVADLTKLGFVDFVPVETRERLISKKLNFLTEKGLDYFWTNHRVGDGQTSAPASGGNGLRHDNEVKQIRLALLSNRNVSAASVYEHQLVPRRSPVKPDLGFKMEFSDRYGWFFHEHQRAHSKKSPKDEMMQDLSKAKAYIEYAKSGKFRNFNPAMDDFRVSFDFPTREKALNFARRLHAEGGGFDRRRFWITSFDELTNDPFGKIWVTPRDTDTHYGLADI